MRVLRFTFVFGLTLFACSLSAAQTGVVSIDYVTYAIGAGSQLLAGHYHQLAVRYNLTGLAPDRNWGGMNGFELYSPDGADWEFMSGSFGPLVLGLPESVTRYAYHYQHDGSNWSRTPNNGADPCPGADVAYKVGYRLATVDFSGGGYPGGSNDIALVFEFRTREADDGLTICFDSAGAVASNGVNTWEWASGGQAEHPLWDNGLSQSGPRCWQIVNFGCCLGYVGDANSRGGGQPTIGDVSAMIDAKYISGDCEPSIPCLSEADINQSGGYDPTCDDITIADISYLVDYLFITGPELGLPLCLL